MDTAFSVGSGFVPKYPSGIFCEDKPNIGKDGTATVMVSTGPYRPYVITYSYRNSPLTVDEIKAELEKTYVHLLAVVANLPDSMAAASKQTFRSDIPKLGQMQITMTGVTEQKICWEYTLICGENVQMGQGFDDVYPPAKMIMEYLDAHGISPEGQATIIRKSLNLTRKDEEYVNEAAVAYVNSLPVSPCWPVNFLPPVNPSANPWRLPM